MVTLYPQPIKHTMNILFPKRILETIPSQEAASSIYQAKPEIVHIQTVFPFDLFRDSLIVDSETVTIVHRGVPPIEHVETIPIEVITDVSVHRGFFLASLVLVAANIRNPITLSITKLRPNEAQCAHRIIECLMAMKRTHAERENPLTGNGKYGTRMVH